MIKLLAITAASLLLLTACAAKPTAQQRCVELGFVEANDMRYCRLQLLALESNERAAIKAGLAASLFADHGDAPRQVFSASGRN
jgi:hypothetical protein